MAHGKPGSHSRRAPRAVPRGGQWEAPGGAGWHTKALVGTCPPEMPLTLGLAATGPCRAHRSRAELTNTQVLKTSHPTSRPGTDLSDSRAQCWARGGGPGPPEGLPVSGGWRGGPGLGEAPPLPSPPLPSTPEEGSGLRQGHQPGLPAPPLELGDGRVWGQPWGWRAPASSDTLACHPVGPTAGPWTPGHPLSVPGKATEWLLF